ncbi:hypothetical protein [Leadbettera azotonutricia]|uniref:Putative lipoprotein n=1 Tax=Leadbettera azotonutricia (strain ATCC BAA-888 / DSM 13862 / ZAS-9) TaxID=545695 RepID=F5YDL5_LEAAZ|nr:hypothetical protein [Leadbettera azotonutricia]AEF83378.1 putative lipoprotein [Leadbettera azotonutricia ZAS-9]
MKKVRCVSVISVVMLALVLIGSCSTPLDDDKEVEKGTATIAVYNNYFYNWYDHGKYTVAVEKGQKLPALSNPPVIEGLAFKGWTKNLNDMGEKGFRELYNFNDTVEGDFALYALHENYVSLDSADSSYFTLEKMYDRLSKIVSWSWLNTNESSFHPNYYYNPSGNKDANNGNRIHINFTKYGSDYYLSVDLTAKLLKPLDLSFGTYNFVGNDTIRIGFSTAINSDVVKNGGYLQIPLKLDRYLGDIEPNWDSFVLLDGESPVQVGHYTNAFAQGLYAKLAERGLNTLNFSGYGHEKLTIYDGTGYIGSFSYSLTGL